MQVGQGSSAVPLVVRLPGMPPLSKDDARQAELRSQAAPPLRRAAARPCSGPRRGRRRGARSAPSAFASSRQPSCGRLRPPTGGPLRDRGRCGPGALRRLFPTLRAATPSATGAVDPSNVADLHLRGVTRGVLNRNLVLCRRRREAQADTKPGHSSGTRGSMTRCRPAFDAHAENRLERDAVHPRRRARCTRSSRRGRCAERRRRRRRR